MQTPEINISTHMTAVNSYSDNFLSDNDINRDKETSRNFNKAVNILASTTNAYGSVYGTSICNASNAVIGRARTFTKKEYEAIRDNAFNDNTPHIELSDGFKRFSKYNLPLTAPRVNEKGRIQLLEKRSNSFLSRNNTNITPNLGVLQTIDTLTYVKQTIVQQKFYEVNLTDYVPVTAGEGGFQRQITEYTSFMTSDMVDKANFSLTGTRAVQRARTDIAFSTINLPTVYYINEVDYTVIEVQELAAGRLPMSAIELKESAAAKKFFLSHQNMILNDGIFNNTGILGLGNLNLTPGASVLTNTTLIPGFIYNMTPTQYQTLVSQILEVYRQNSNYTEMPDTFVVPEAEFWGLFGAFVNPAFPVNKMGEDLLNTFKRSTKNDNFQILPNAYFDAGNNAENLYKYALYRNARDVLETYAPVPYQSTAFQTMNGFDFASINFAQVTGLLLKRDRAFVYFTHA